MENQENGFDLFQDVFDTAKSGAIVLDEHCRVVWANKGIERFFGLQADELIGKDKCALTEDILGKIIDKPGNYTEQALSAYGDPECEARFEFHVPAVEGHAEFWLEQWIRPIRTGRYLGGRVEIYFDITERKQTEQVHREREDQFQRIFTQSAVGQAIVVWDEPLRDVNQALCDMLGYTREEMLEKRIVDITHSDDYEADRVLAAQAAASEISSYDLEKRYLHRDGSVRWGLLKAIPLQEQGSHTVFLGQVLDITERKNVEQALRESEQRFSKAFHAAPVAICITRLPDGYLEDANQAFQDLTGYSEREFLGVRPLDLHLFVHPDRYNGFAEAVRQKGSLHQVDLKIRMKQGEVKDVLFSGEVIDLLGEPCVLMMLYDITDRKRLEREILEIGAREQRRIGRDLHDDLGQKLTAAAFYSDVLQQSLEENGSESARYAVRLSELLQEAHKSTRHLSHGLAPMAVGAEGLEGALDTLAENTEDVYGLRCRFICKEQVMVQDDDVAMHLYRIAQEAVSNAVRHGKPDAIHLYLYRQESAVCLKIKDNGAGISEDVLLHTRGIGLNTMKYRADVIGASLNVRRDEKGGTVVECMIDLPTALHD